MLSWIFQAYADAFSVATFQTAQHPVQKMDAEQPRRYGSPTASIWQRRAPTSTRSGAESGEPPARYAA
jgi:hypothetical protein